MMIFNSLDKYLNFIYVENINMKIVLMAAFNLKYCKMHYIVGYCELLYKASEYPSVWNPITVYKCKII